MSDSLKQNDGPKQDDDLSKVGRSDEAGLDRITYPELFFGLVGPVGTDLSIVCSSLQDELAKVGYGSTVVRFSKLLHRFPQFNHLKEITHEERRYEEHMKAGTELRKMFESGDALGQVALLEVGEIRKKHHGQNVTEGERLPIGRHAFIFHSLKHPDEVRFFRKVYGKAFSLIAINSLRDKRINSLSEKISNSHFQSDPPHFRANAERLISIDENEEGEKFGQNVRDTFPLADYFIRSDERSDLVTAIGRFIGLLFNSPFDTPSKSELAMFHAKAAALRSADLSRQVGAVITGNDGDIISTGCNEVPKAGGGLYWSGEGDARDFQLGYDPNSKIKRDIVLEILGRMKEAGWLSEEKKAQSINSLLNSALNEGKKPIFEGARVSNVIEFGRIIHAEMAAILHAARRGTSIDGTTLHCTTFPCHMCARHIVAAGIKTVVFIEPYPKSMAHDLYADSISINTVSDRFVNFIPFEGVAPRKFIELFEKFKRKDDNGKAFVWNERVATPNLERLISSYVIVERRVILSLEAVILRLGLNRLAEHLTQGEVNAAGSEGT